MLHANSQNLRALIVDDSEDDTLLLVHALEDGGYLPDWLRVDNRKALINAMKQNWDIVFGDFTMPRFSGVDALRLVRQHDSLVPFVFVSGTIGEETAVNAMRSGAQDYIIKGNFSRLIPTVERELRERRLRAEHRALEIARRESDRQFRNILAMAADAVITIDEHLRITIFNRAAEIIFGYDAAQVIGQQVGMLFPETLRESQRDVIRRFLQLREPSSSNGARDELYGLRKNGDSFPAEASFSVLSSNGLTTLTIFLRDISERKQAEEEMRLLQLTTKLASEADDMTDALRKVLNQICASTVWNFAQAWVPRDDGTIECGRAWASDIDSAEPFRVVSTSKVLAPDEDLPGRVWVSQRPQWSRNFPEEFDSFRAEIAAESGLRTSLALPVYANDNEILTVLEFFTGKVLDRDEHQLHLLQSVATQLGGVLHRKHVEERLHYLAHYDEVTGLPNRILFEDRLHQAMLDANRRNTRVAIMFLDLDRFKNVNDSLGHATGDLFLEAVAERLRDCVRGGDTVARLAGDEFTIILNNIGEPSDVERVASKLMNEVCKSYYVAGHELFISVSLGITIYPTDGDNIETLLRNADMAMYRAKESGGNAFEFHSQDMTSRAHERLLVENDLRRALKNDEFELHYQPIIDARNNSIYSIEALVRWDHPKRGLIYPDQFIHIAEESGLIADIDKWVLKEACRSLHIRDTAWGERVRLAINVSAPQFNRAHMVADISEILAETSCSTERLDLEITESMLMLHSDIALAIMNELNDIGIHFSIDDFGTGYSSLSYLKNLPIDYLKIDRSFVLDAPDDPNDVAIIQAIISMAHSLGIRTIAEGVETEAQYEFLKSLGCEYMQGYLFCKPVPLDELRQRFDDDGTLLES